MGLLKAFQKKKLESLIDADDAAGLDAFLKKHPKAVEWEEVHGPNHQTYIHKAVQNQKYAAAGVLLDHGARIDQLGIGGGTLLECALRISFSGDSPMNAEDEAFALKLLAKGADINQNDCRGFPPLKTAAWQGNADIVKFLLAHGADPNAGEKSGTTVLMDMASHRGWDLTIVPAQKIAALLLGAGADVHLQTNIGMTALFFANDMVTAERLLERGADPEHIDKRGRHIWDVEGNKNCPVSAALKKVAEQRQQARASEALDRDAAVCHEGVRPVTMKPLTLKPSR